MSHPSSRNIVLRRRMCGVQCFSNNILDKMASAKLWYCVVIITTSAYAIPECKYIGENQSHIICSSTEAYILTRGLVSDNDTTTGVILKDCRITNIDYESFENMPSLKFIDLSRNKITNLTLGVLDGIRTVSNLNLSYNSLSEFPLGVFDQMPNLAVLDLTGNKLHNFQLGIFDPLIKLKVLKVSNNLLIGKDLNPYIFDESWQINYFDLSRNDMADSPEILLQSFRSLETLILDKCFLNTIPSFAVKSNLKTLKQLILSRNHISKIKNSTTFVNLDNLETLDLADNGIEIISEDVFKPLKKLKAIALRGNRLTELPSTLFKNIKSLISIDLSHNLISTVPVNAFRGTSLKNLNLANNRFTYLIDNFCLELNNSGAKLSKFYFNQNPWQCSCLINVVDEVKRMNIKYNSLSYDGTHPVCVTTSERHCKRNDDFNSIYTNMYDDLILNASI